MSIHYLIDPFTDNGDIIDVVSSDTGQINATGANLVKIPTGAFVQDNPTNLSELLIEKYDSLLASYAGFTTILSDPCLDSTDFAGVTNGLLGSGFVNHAIEPGGFIVSTTFDLSPDTPSAAVLLWEEYSFSDSDSKDGRLERTYVEGTGSALTCVTTFNASGAEDTQNPTNGAVLNIPASEQGDSFYIGFLNTGGARVYLGSWALIY